METYIVRKKIAINAAPAAVWDALTDPEKTKKYFFNCEVISDWEVGSTITFKGRLFFILNVEMQGHIIQIEPQRLLHYTLKNSGGHADSSTYSTVKEELQYVDGETILSITDDVGEGEGAEKRFARSEKGWDKVLKGLKELVEKENEQRRAAA